LPKLFLKHLRKIPSTVACIIRVLVPNASKDDGVQIVSYWPGSHVRVINAIDIFIEFLHCVADAQNLCAFGTKVSFTLGIFALKIFPTYLLIAGYYSVNN
jgi:hypothetical protein